MTVESSLESPQVAAHSCCRVQLNLRSKAHFPEPQADEGTTG